MEKNLRDALPLYCEVLPDWENGTLATENGTITRVYGGEALKQWVKKALLPETTRNDYEAYSANYGHDLKWLFGRPMTDTLPDLVSATVCEALYANPYILKVTCTGSKIADAILEMSFEIETIYNTFNINEVYKL